jgi:Fic family protein
VPFDDEIARRYPHIAFEKTWEFDADTHYLLGKCDAIVQTICRIPLQPDRRRKLFEVSLIKGAQATTAIEGNTLSEAEVRRVLEGQSLPPSKEYQEREVRNIIDAMNDIGASVTLDGHAALITEAQIKRFHQAVGRELGDRFDAIPGRFRTDSRTVGPYLCPRPEHVEELVRRLCEWLPREFAFPTDTQTFAQAVTQAIVTHVYLEWIHPFADGNGRTGRLLEFYILLRGGNPDIASHILSNYYNQTRPEYYRQLDLAGKTRNLSAFLKYAIRGYHDGLQEILTTLSESSIATAWRELVYARFDERPHRKHTVAKRRRLIALAMPPTQELSADAIMMLSPDLMRQYAALTPRTLERDLQELKAMGILLEEDGKYRLNLGLLVPQMARRRRVATSTGPQSS